MLSELRAVLRSLSRSPGYTFSVVAILALGIGASAAIFSVVAGTLFPALHYQDPSSLVRIESLVRNTPYPWASPLIRFVGYRDSATSFTAIGGVAYDSDNLILPDGPIGVSVGRTTPEFFTVLGTKPALGRVFFPREAEPGADGVAILSYYAWRSRFNEDPGILGRELRVGRETCRVVGVLDRRFQAPNGSISDVYLPWLPPTGALDQQQAGRHVNAVGRLKPGVSLEQARPSCARSVRRKAHNSSAGSRPLRWC